MRERRIRKMREKRTRKSAASVENRAPTHEEEGAEA
jgi:hypothetical protein